MPCVAPKSGHVGAVHFPKNSSAVGAVIRYLLSQTVNFRHIAQHSFRDLCLNPDVSGDPFAFAWKFMSERYEQTPHFTDRHTVVDLEIIEGALRHAGISSVVRILDNRNAAALFDR